MRCWCKLAANLFIDSLLSLVICFFSRIDECLSRLFFKGRRRGSGFFEDFFDLHGYRSLWFYLNCVPVILEYTEDLSHFPIGE